VSELFTAPKSLLAFHGWEEGKDQCYSRWGGESFSERPGPDKQLWYKMESLQTNLSFTTSQMLAGLPKHKLSLVSYKCPLAWRKPRGQAELQKWGRGLIPSTERSLGNCFSLIGHSDCPWPQAWEHKSAKPSVWKMTICGQELKINWKSGRKGKRREHSRGRIPSFEK
jgi:hypothetical protein